MEPEKIAVFGLGYVGITTAACFAKLGNHVIGVDINPERVKAISEGHSPIPIGGIDDLLKEQVKSGRLKTTTNYEEAIDHSNISFVCVQTPCKANGDLDLTALNRVCAQIGTKIGRSQPRFYHTVVIRSTIFPGTLGKLEKVLEGRSGLKVHKDFGLAVNPEFLREAYAVEDFFNPPFVVIGAETKEEFDEEFDDVGKLYGYGIHVKAPVIHVTPDVAQMIKYVSNSWHAVKVAYTNEIGEICRRIGVDGDAVMGLFKRDHKLNVSEYYHKPGKAYGGHCLPKDLAVLQCRARMVNADVPIINAVSISNYKQSLRDKK